MFHKKAGEAEALSEIESNRHDPSVRLIHSALHIPFWIYRRLKRWISTLKIANVVLIHGKSGSTGETFSILYAGGENNKNYLAHLAFGGRCEEERLGRLWLWELIRVIRKNKASCAFLAIESHHFIFKFIPLHHLFFMPDWINGEIDLSIDLKGIEKRNRTSKENIRKIRKNGLEYEIVSNERLFDHFYYEMYLPYINARFDDLACIREYQVLKKDFINGNLLLVKKDGTAIAGVILKYKDKQTIEMTRIGILDGNSEFVKMGALSAAYYFTFAYAKEEGYEKIDVGGSRPFLKDGVLNYKKNNWRMEITTFYRHGMIFKPLYLNTAAKQFLLDNPFISIIKGQPMGVIFGDKEPSSLDSVSRRALSRLRIKGLGGMLYFTIDERGDDPADQRQFIGCELGERYAIGRDLQSFQRV